MSDGLEIVMDDETREALEMTKDEREARWNAGKPAKVRKSEDFVQRMKRVVDESTENEGVETGFALRVSAGTGGNEFHSVVISTGLAVGGAPVTIRG
jgi:hypothetical protein